MSFKNSQSNLALLIRLYSKVPPIEYNCIKIRMRAKFRSRSTQKDKELKGYRVKTVIQNFSQRHTSKKKLLKLLTKAIKNHTSEFVDIKNRQPN